MDMGRRVKGNGAGEGDGAARRPSAHAPLARAVSKGVSPSVVRPVGRPKDAGKRALIVAAAWDLFLRDGFEGVSMDDIAARAGVSKATVYSHFVSKESLFEGVVRARVESFPVVVPPDLSDRAAFRRAIESFGHRLLSILTNPGVHGMHRLLMAHRERHPELLAIVHRNGPRRMQTEVAALLTRGHEMGHLDVPDAMLAADQLLSMWKGMAHVALEMGVAGPRSAAEGRRHVKACTEVLFRAYAGEGS